LQDFPHKVTYNTEYDRDQGGIPLVIFQYENNMMALNRSTVKNFQNLFLPKKIGDEAVCVNLSRFYVELAQPQAG